MTPRDEASYRIGLARTHLRAAEQLLYASIWPQCALLARAALENAAKAILACFKAVPRTHEPADILRSALSERRFPAALIVRGRDLLPILSQYGMSRHVQLAYGDEQNLLLPDALIQEEDARQAIADARAIVVFSADVQEALFSS